MTIKKYIWDENKPPIYYRPGTSDEKIIQSILVERQEYLFPSFKPEIVYDIGANIGVATVILSNIYPEAQIYAFEPDPDNYNILKMNIEKYKNIIAYEAGIAEESGRYSLWKSEDPSNHGGCSMVIANTEDECIKVDMMAIDFALKKLGIPDVVKIDVEGAEAEIFHAFPNLDKVKWITGELHGVRDYQVLDLLSEHFYIQCARGFEDKCWHFHAANRAWAKALDSTQR